MSGAKALTTLRNVLLNRHVRIAKAYQANAIALFGQYCKLLALAGSALRLVIA